MYYVASETELRCPGAVKSRSPANASVPFGFLLVLPSGFGPYPRFDYTSGCVSRTGAVTNRRRCSRVTGSRSEAVDQMGRLSTVQKVSFRNGDIREASSVLSLSVGFGWKLVLRVDSKKT